MDEDTLKEVAQDLEDMEHALFIKESRGETPKISSMRETLSELVELVNTYREESAAYIASLQSQLEAHTNEVKSD